MKKVLLFAMLSAALSVQAAPKPKTIFSCSLLNGKQVLITQTGKNYRYHYGKKGNWELVFENPLEQIKRQTKTPEYHNRVHFTMLNGNYEYTVFTAWNIDRNNSGLEVNRKNTDTFVFVEDCNMKKPLREFWEDEFMR